MSRLPEIANPHRQAYPSEPSAMLSGRCSLPLLPKPKGFGRPRTVDLREISMLFSMYSVTGCQWEMLPHDLPPHDTAYKYFQKWRYKGIWQEIHDTLRHQLRRKMGREDDSSVAVSRSECCRTADSQSVKTTEKRGRSTVLMVARRLKAVSAT